MSFKKAVQLSFSKAAGTYNDFSDIQQKAADDLVDRLVQRLAKERVPYETKLSILDIGCGPGVLESRLRKHLSNFTYTGIDLSFSMVREANRTKSLPTSAFVAADMDCLPFQNGSFDVVISSSTLQWSTPDSFPWMNEVNRLLRPRGIFCFNLMAEGSLKNFYDTYREVRKAPYTLHRYPDKNLLAEKLRQLFQDCVIEHKTYRKQYPNLLDFLRDVQKTGARSAVTSGKAPLTKSFIREIEEKLRENDKEIPIDYLFQFGVGKKA